MSPPVRVKGLSYYQVRYWNHHQVKDALDAVGIIQRTQIKDDDAVLLRSLAKKEKEIAMVH